MIRLRSTFLPFLASASVLLAACGGNDASNEAPNDMPAEAETGAMMETAPMESFMATLSGEAERPDPVTTTATGRASFVVHADSISYTVDATNLMGVTAVHIHSGGVEESGPPMVTLYSSDAGVDVPTGSVAAGTITRETTLNGETTFDQLREQVRMGAAYVNIHTVANPKGEIRGQTTAGASM